MEDKKHSDKKTNVSEEINNSESQYTNVDAIIDFYKDKPAPENDDEKIISSDESVQNPVSSLVNRLFSKNKIEAPSVCGSMNGDEDIHSGEYGINGKYRAITTHIATALLCLGIIAGSYYLAVILPNDTQTIDRYAEPLRNEAEYKSLSNRYNSLSHEVAELEASNKEKKEKADNVSDYDNTKAALRTEIKAKSDELNTLNLQIAEKKELISALDSDIALKAPSDITLNAGRYVIGTTIAAGKYYITGAGTFTAASSDGVSKYNFLLGSTSHEVTLEKGDIIKINSSVRFTSAN